MVKSITSLGPPTRLHIRTGTFLGDELGSNSNLKCPKHRRMVAGDNVISATYSGGQEWGLKRTTLPKGRLRQDSDPKALTIGIAHDVGFRIGFP